MSPSIHLAQDGSQMISTFGKPPKGAWRMVALGFAAQNFAIGLSIASFGIAVLAIEREFHTTRTLASLGASLVLVAFGLFAPVVTRLIELWSIRTTMMIGVALGSAGYVALALAPHIWLFLAAYWLLVGSGALLSGNFPASILVSNWVPGAKGRALGVMMIPLGVMLVPLACAPILEAIGLRRLYLVIGAVNLLMLPPLLMVRDRPGQTVGVSASKPRIASTARRFASNAVSASAPPTLSATASLGVA